ncbi:hypothetical protein Hdeb2414_s0008g00283561 [Helianthus debilis subsp. tardiflorus]
MIYLKNPVVAVFMKTITLSASTALLCCNSEARLGLGDKLTVVGGQECEIWSVFRYTGGEKVM